jgi:signal transduction histidine kinase
VAAGRHTVLRGLAEHSLEAASLDELLEVAVGAVADTLPVTHTGVFECGPDGERMHLRAGAGWLPDAVGEAWIGRGLDSHAGRVLDTAGPVTAGFDAGDPFRTPALFRSEGIVQGLAVAIRANGRPFGMLAAYSTGRTPFRPADGRFLARTGTLLAGAVQRLGAEDVLRASEDRRRLVLERRLAAGVAHELKNALFALHGYGELAAEALERGEDPREDLEHLLRAAGSVRDLTEVLDGFARRPALDSEFADVNDVVSGLRPVLAWLVGPEIDLAVVPAPEPVAVTMPHHELELVVINLALAVRGALEQGGRVVVEASLGDVRATDRSPLPAGRYAVVTVTARGTSATSDLGLASARATVEGAGGTILLERTPRVGTVFRIQLPLA